MSCQNGCPPRYACSFLGRFHSLCCSHHSYTGELPERPVHCPKAHTLWLPSQAKGALVGSKGRAEVLQFSGTFCLVKCSLPVLKNWVGETIKRACVWEEAGLTGKPVETWKRYYNVMRVWSCCWFPLYDLVSKKAPFPLHLFLPPPPGLLASTNITSQWCSYTSWHLEARHFQQPF